MAYNKFVKTTKEVKPVRLKVRNPQGQEYTIDPWMESSQMKSWELTAAIRYFMDLGEAAKKHKPNRFVHVHRHHH